MDTATEGSVVQETASAGAPDVQPAVVDNGSPAPAPTDPFSGLQDEGARKWVETKGYKSPSDVVKAAQSLEERLGTSISVPKEDAPAEEWKKFHDRLPEAMRPVESADKLDLKRPEGLPEGLPWNADAEAAFKTWAVEDGLSAKQAQGQLDKFAKFQAEQFTALQEKQAKAVSDTHSDLTKEWGPLDSEGFKTKLALADRAASKLGLVDAFKEAGVILPDGSLTNPQIAKALSVVGESMFREDTIGDDRTVITDNPFKRDADGKPNLTGINALVKSDPDRAKRLAREAGENPTRWGL